MSHSLWLCNNPYPEPNQTSSPFFFAMVIPTFQSSSKILGDVSEQICFYSVRLLASRQTPKLRTTPGWLSTSVYSIYLQLRVQNSIFKMRDHESGLSCHYSSIKCRNNFCL